MNILVPHQWLLEHIDTSIDPKELQRIVSLSGPSIERIETRQQEPVYDIEVTTNRMDSASIRGIAREAHVILSFAGKKTKLKLVDQYKPQQKDIIHDGSSFPIHIENDDHICSRVSCVLMRVKNMPSPAWMQKRLEQVGIRPLGNVIDITNYIMIEMGHPAHVFDADRVGNTMIIRESKAGEKITTLDDKTYTLAGGDVVIDNGKGELIDLVGVMGTANSVVQNDTTRILFFIDHANAKRIRTTSMRHAIRTKAAQLNEKMVDPNLAMETLLRGIHLYQQIAEGTVESPILDIYPQPIEKKVITLPLSLTKAYLGIDIPSVEQQTILENLGCKTRVLLRAIQATIPTSRPDLEIPVDLVEEIARIYGYHNLPSVIMDTPIPTTYPEHTSFSLEHRVKEFLASIGWQEVYTYSAVSEALADQSGFSHEQHIALQNPLNEEHMYLRQSMIPSHEEVISQNPQTRPLSVFEIANIYTPREKDLPVESLHVTMTSTLPFREAKGAFEALMEKLYVRSEHIQYAQKNNAATIIVQEKSNDLHIGNLSVLPNGHVAIDLIWEKVLQVARAYPSYRPIPKFQSVVEDITITIPTTVSIGEVIQTIRTYHPYIISVVLKDLYKQNATFQIEYLDNSAQLTANDITPIRSQLVSAIQKKYNAMLVGTLQP